MSKTSRRKLKERRLAQKMSLYNQFNGKGNKGNGYNKPGSGKK